MRRVREIYGEVGAGAASRRRGASRAVVSAHVRIALVHDWLTGMRGGEKALEVLCERFPDAELFTLVHVPRLGVAGHRAAADPHVVRPAPAAASGGYYRQYLPLFPTAVEQFDLERFDLVLSISHCCAKSVVRPAAAPAPLLLPDADALRLGPVRRLLRTRRASGGSPARLMRPVMARLARWDRETADRADRYVAISHYVAGRIRRYYNREATVVYPPVDTDFLPPGRRPARALRARRVGAGALQTHRRWRSTPARCAGVPLTIVGDGPERAALERAARDGRRRVPRPPVRRRHPRPVPARGGRAAAGRGGLRHRAARGAGVRPAGRRARPRRRASRRSSTAKPACSSTSRRPRRLPTPSRRAVDRPVRRGGHPAARRTVRPRAVRRRDGGARRATRRTPGRR